MDSNSGEKIPSSVQPLHHHHYRHDGRHRHHHHHHFFYISPHCPLHHSILLPKNHSPSCSFSTSYPSHQNIASIPTKPHLRFGDTQRNETFEEFPIIENGIEKLDLEEDEEEEEEPIFVLTDEWREFFAKSEAKRRLAKKQAKKRKN